MAIKMTTTGLAKDSRITQVFIRAAEKMGNMFSVLLLKIKPDSDERNNIREAKKNFKRLVCFVISRYFEC